MLGRLLLRIGRARWVTVSTEDGDELAFRIFGVNVGYYKDHVPLLWPAKPWREVVKREYGESIKPRVRGLSVTPYTSD